MPGVAPVEPGGYAGYAGVSPGAGVAFAPPGVKVLLGYHGTGTVGSGEEGAEVVGVGIVVSIGTILAHHDCHQALARTQVVQVAGNGSGIIFLIIAKVITVVDDDIILPQLTFNTLVVGGVGVSEQVVALRGGHRLEERIVGDALGGGG